MREFNVLKGYPQPNTPRYVGPNIRTIKNRIIAAYRDERYYDGDRNNGSGGFKYDGRWKLAVDSMCNEYGLTEKSAVLNLGCEKGFIMHDFHEKFPNMKIIGADVSEYAINNGMPSIKQYIMHLDTFAKLPFADKEFDFVTAIGVVYCLNLYDAIRCIKEIQRVGRGKSFITLGSYRNEQEAMLFRHWTLLGSTVLHVDQWVEVLKHAGYTGDYAFTNAETLNLVLKVD
jgi:ubiquinone/menaquinone biosynthesis C-methylase UbiE